MRVPPGHGLLGRLVKCSLQKRNMSRVMAVGSRASPFSRRCAMRKGCCQGQGARARAREREVGARNAFVHAPGGRSLRWRGPRRSVQGACELAQVVVGAARAAARSGGRQRRSVSRSPRRLRAARAHPHSIRCASCAERCTARSLGGSRQLSSTLPARRARGARLSEILELLAPLGLEVDFIVERLGALLEGRLRRTLYLLVHEYDLRACAARAWQTYASSAPPPPAWRTDARARRRRPPPRARRAERAPPPAAPPRACRRQVAPPSSQDPRRRRRRHRHHPPTPAHARARARAHAATRYGHRNSPHIHSQCHQNASS